MGKVNLETIAGGALGLGLGVITGAGVVATGVYTLAGAALGELVAKYQPKYHHSQYH